MMTPVINRENPRFLTAREVAELLRTSTRKIYDLAAADEIPHRRATGKLLFSESEISAWLLSASRGRASERPAVIAGSHDPLLEWAARESGSGLASLIDGSMDGLARFARGEAAMCGLHIPETEGWNVATVSSMDFTGCVLITWSYRIQGLMLGDVMDGRVAEMTDLEGCRFALRQEGAGSRALFDRFVAENNIDLDGFFSSTLVVRTETEAAAAVASGQVDAALGLMAAARSQRLAFLPLVTERFDMVIDRRSFFTAPLQALLGFTREPAFLERATGLGGYDLADLGTVRWLSP